MLPEIIASVVFSVQGMYAAEQKKIAARVGDTLLDAALDNGIPLEHECGGNCACTTCHVKIVSGAENLSAMEDAESDRLAFADDRTSVSRLGCQAILRGGNVDVVIVGETN